MTTRVVIVGAGGHAAVAADALLEARRAGGAVELVAFVDSNPELRGSSIRGIPVHHGTSSLKDISHDAVVVGVGNNADRARLYDELVAAGERMFTVIHPRSVVSEDAQVGPGSVLFAGAIVNPGSSIGANVILNTGCSVDHHNSIGAHAHVAPGAHTGGNVRVGEGCLVGLGSSISPGRSIGEWTVVGAGAVVIDDLPARCTAIGVPARIME